MEQKFKREMRSLDEVFRFIERFVGDNGIDPAVAYSVSLAVEEFFTNLVKYNPSSSTDIILSLRRAAGKVTVRLVDEQREAFDVTQAREADTTVPLKERKVGGLGIFLARQLIDSLEYSHAGGTSTITFTKNLE